MTLSDAAVVPRRSHPAEAGDDLLTTEEFADLIRTPESTVRYWRHIGTGPRGVRIGRRVLYRRTDINEWIAARYTEQERQHGVA